VEETGDRGSSTPGTAPTGRKFRRKADHLRFKSDFDYTRKTGEKSIGPSLVLVVAPPREGRVRCGVVCGKKYSPSAVVRNRARRLLWESFRHLRDRIAPAELVLIPRYRMADRKEPEVRNELALLLAKAGVFSAEGPIGASAATGEVVSQS